MPTLTHWKKLTNPLYLGAYSIEDGQDLVLTIKTVTQEVVMGADGKKEDCTVCYFSDAEKPMILNSTNCKVISKLANTPYIEKWTGLRIQIGVEKVKAFGDVVEALRVRKFAPKVTTTPCEVCGKDIIAASGLSADQLAAYTHKKYGLSLCAECAMVKASGTEKKEETSAADQ